jgi:DNA-binding response OmpR family regulator
MTNNKNKEISHEVNVFEVTDNFEKKISSLINELFKLREQYNGIIKPLITTNQKAQVDRNNQIILKTKNNDIVVNRTEHTTKVRINNKYKYIKLKPKQYELLCLFLTKKNRELNRTFIGSYVWEINYLGNNKSIDNTVSSLRKRLGVPFEKRIECIWGIGYKFNDK